MQVWESREKLHKGTAGFTSQLVRMPNEFLIRYRIRNAIQGASQVWRRKKFLKMLVMPKLIWGSQWMRYTKEEMKSIASMVERTTLPKAIIGRSRTLV